MSIFALVKVKDGEKGGVDRHEESFHTNDIWLAEKGRGWWCCRKDGYGTQDNYRSGAAYFEEPQLEFLTPMVLRESKLLDEYRHLFF